MMMIMIIRHEYIQEAVCGRGERKERILRSGKRMEVLCIYMKTAT
jgi:hypothetical protein